MEEAIEKARKAVADCNLKSDSSHLKTIKTLLASLGTCRRYIKENSQTDRGCAQRIARSFDEVLEQLPSMRRHEEDKGDAHTRRLAEEHLDKLHEQLSSIAKELEKLKKQQILDWVKKHPVFSELKGKLTGALPKGAYVLLFRKAGDERVELLTQTSKDERIFTRFKPHEFKDATKLHRYFQGKKSVVGAAIIAGRELIAVIGDVSRPENDEELLRHLLAVSSEAASTPVREFLQSNTPLKELHELSSRHKLPKQSYVLLFQARQQQPVGSQSVESQPADPQPADAQPADSQPVESQPADSQPVDSQPADSQPVDSQPVDAQSVESQPADSQPADSQPADSQPGDLQPVDQQPVDSQPVDSQPADSQPVDSQPADSQPADSQPGDLQPVDQQPVDRQSVDLPLQESQPELWERTTADGRTVTRFWPNEFADKYKVFDTFRDKATVVGAAVIHENKLFKGIGQLPGPIEGKDQLQVILQVSRMVMDRPVTEFLEENLVLKELNRLAKAGSTVKETHVLLFVQAEAGKVEVLSVSVGKGKLQTRIPITEFESAKSLHSRLSGGKRVVGASVIGQEKTTPARKAGAPTPRDRADQGDGHRRQFQAPVKEVVLAAFGRTPLRVGHLATADTLRRLGINL